MLLAGFPLLLLLMIWMFCAGLILAQYGASSTPISLETIGNAAGKGVDLSLEYGYFALIFAVIWFVVAWLFHAKMIRMATGARPMTRKECPKIYNMLENMCISRGLSMPKLQVIDAPQLNAFASGINEKTYSITLTRGIIEALEDDELEAVIAHELTHIINKDVRLLIIGVIFVGMISFFAELAFRSLLYGGRGHRHRYSSGGNKKNNGGAIVIVALVVLVVGYIFAIAIRFALSRKREYLADAGSVELTRNPAAMMRALMRISGKDQVKDMPGEVQQMCIENSHNFLGMFATHPPISDRIAAISEMTSTPIPELTVSLRRPPKGPWEK